MSTGEGSSDADEGAACVKANLPEPQAATGTLTNECPCQTCCPDPQPEMEGGAMCCEVAVTLLPVERSWPQHIGSSGPAAQPFHAQYSVNLGQLPRDVTIIGAVVQYGLPVSGGSVQDDGGSSNASQMVHWGGTGLKKLTGAYPGSLTVNVYASWPTPPDTTTFSVGTFVVKYIDPHFPYLV